jgi:hypothetical protein
MICRSFGDRLHFHVYNFMPTFSCLRFHVYIFMSTFSCLHFHVYIFMSTFSCLHFHVCIFLSAFSCLQIEFRHFVVSQFELLTKLNATAANFSKQFVKRAFTSVVRPTAYKCDCELLPPGLRVFRRRRSCRASSAESCSSLGSIL